ncbi:M56 family metallopeptidase [Undibacterium sp. TS12]|uniref:M56 family metallopeptidase n=1 Tax=Undibacterium sp. TS12 TaxID=2908202 RepID=UPI001F4C5360|nr:M56 family metallopeptidase [Undibacterium sp. TS12]MCH8619607.1 M56 family metallopeptidase [Undibacterium sp. TS12]
MVNDILDLLLGLAIISSAVLMLVLCLRLPLRHYFGANLAYQSWILLPLVLLAGIVAAVLPHKTVQQAALQLPAEQVATGAATALGLAPVIWPYAMLAIWLAGLLACLLWFALQQTWFMRSLGKLQAHENIYLAEYAHAGPAVAGLWRTKIIMPADFFERYDATEQELILRHEQIHQHRRDVSMNTLFALLQCLFWFNPLVHLAARCFRLDQELACDALVIRHHPAARRDYAQAMLKTQLNLQTSSLACHWQSHHPLKERIMHLSHNYPSRARRFSAYVMLACAATVSTYSAWANAPQLAAPQATTTAGQHELAGSFAVSTTIKIEGKTFSPKVVARSGDQAVVRITEAGAQWDFLMTVTAQQDAKSDDLALLEKIRKNSGKPVAADAALLSMVISKNGAVLAQPRLLVGLDQTARIQQEKPDHKGDFDISLIASIVK